MKIAYISAGAGGMYCGSCLNDSTLARAVNQRGHEMTLAPMYTPMRTEEEVDDSGGRLFYGAINVYLEQRSSLFRHTPRFVDRLLNNRKLLDWAMSRGASVDAKDLGELTLSTLLGEEGRQRKELDGLLRWLADDYKPELVHLSNSMMLGIAPAVRRELNVPVICSLQGEDIFLDDLEEPYKSRCFETIRGHATSVDAFVATSDYYAGFMREYLGLDGEIRIHPVALGIRLDDMTAPSSTTEPSDGSGASDADDRPFRVGYLARICPEKGLHLLVEAFQQLCRDHPDRPFELDVAGYLGPRDQAYFDEVREAVAQHGLESKIRFRGEVDRQEKIDFLHGVDLLSVPTLYQEPKGRFVLEAWACGVPVLLPDHGAFPELIDSAGGGRLFPAGQAAALAQSLAELSRDRSALRGMGQAGQAAVRRDYDADGMAERMLEVYGRYVP